MGFAFFYAVLLAVLGVFLLVLLLWGVFEGVEIQEKKFQIESSSWSQ